MNNYNKILFKICQDTTVPMYIRRFASLFSIIITISLNPEKDKTVAVFSVVCETMVATYLHRLLQIVDNTLDIDDCVSDYDELNEYVNSIHQEIKTNNNPESTRDLIEKKLSAFC